MDKPETIYIVMGESGEYDDYTSWVVCAYKDCNIAYKHTDLAEDYAKKLIADGWKEKYWAAIIRPPGNPIINVPVNPYDSEMIVVDNQVKYFVIETELMPSNGRIAKDPEVQKE